MKWWSHEVKWSGKLSREMGTHCSHSVVTLSRQIEFHHRVTLFTFFFLQVWLGQKFAIFDVFFFLLLLPCFIMCSNFTFSFVNCVLLCPFLAWVVWFFLLLLFMECPISWWPWMPHPVTQLPPVNTGTTGADTRAAMLNRDLIDWWASAPAKRPASVSEVHTLDKSVRLGGWGGGRILIVF